MNSKSNSLNEAKKMINYDEFFKLNYDNFQNIKNNNIDIDEFDDMTLNLRDDFDVFNTRKSQCFYIQVPNGRSTTVYVDEDNFFGFEDNKEKANSYRKILEFFVKNKILKSTISFKYNVYLEFNKQIEESILTPYFKEIENRCKSIDIGFRYRHDYSRTSMEFSCKIDKSTVLDPNEIPLDKVKLSKDIDSKLGDLMARKRFTQKDKEDLMDIIKSISKN